MRQILKREQCYLGEFQNIIGNVIFLNLLLGFYLWLYNLLLERDRKYRCREGHTIKMGDGGLSKL